jgi:hypothetical protein
VPELYSTWLSYLDAQKSLIDTIVDAIILIAAFVPSVRLSLKLLTTDAASARRLLHSPAVLGWLLFWCSLVMLLQVLKVPIILKVAIAIFAYVLLPFVWILASPGV